MEQLRVVAAAVVASNGTMYSLRPPARHDAVFRYMQARGENCRGATPGFLLSDGRFATRGRAAAVALEAGQLPGDAPAPLALCSEDLW